MKKLLVFDGETTGFDAVKNDIIQLAGVIDIDGKVEEEFDIRMQPFDYDSITNNALEITGLTIDEIKEYQPPQEALVQFKGILAKYINKYDKKDKFYPCGFNVKFDLDFVGEWFKKCGDKYGFGVWQNWKALDPLYYARLLDFNSKLELPNLKLETLCEYFDIKIDAHNALSDAKATRELFYVSKDLL